jgi:hypothetical protein
MSPLRLRLSERTQVALILLLTLGALFATWYFLLLPQRQMNAEIAKLRRDLATSKYAQESIPGLRKAVEAENANAARLEQEWTQTADRLATFANQAALRRAEIGRIDFKVELFHTRQRLVEKSDALGIQLIPVDLGIDDALSSRDNDRIRERMLQLKAVEKLADLTLDRRIERLVSISPLPPRAYKSQDGRFCFDEYPVRAEFDVAFDNLYALFQSVFENSQVFAFRNIRIESGARPNAPVRVNAVMSALVFE